MAMMLTKARLIPAVFLALYLSLVANYYLQASSPGWISGAGTACLITATAAMGLGILLNRNRRTLPWLLLFAGQISFAVGAVINLTYQMASGTFPYPGPADIFELASYPCYVAGLVLLSRTGRPRLALRAFVPAISIAGLAFWVFSWPELISPYTHGRITPLTRAVTIAYPAGDLILLFQMLILLSIVLIIRHLSRLAFSPAFLLILAGTVGILFSDTIFSYVILHYSWSQPSVGDSGWLFFFGTWALAFLIPQAPVRMWFLQGRREQRKSLWSGFRFSPRYQLC